MAIFCAQMVDFCRPGHLLLNHHWAWFYMKMDQLFQSLCLPTMLKFLDDCSQKLCHSHQKHALSFTSKACFVIHIKSMMLSWFSFCHRISVLSKTKIEGEGKRFNFLFLQQTGAGSHTLCKPHLVFRYTLYIIFNCSIHVYY